MTWGRCSASRPSPVPTKRFIGPLLPAHLIAERKAQADQDPQAELLKRKIAERRGSTSAPSSPTKPSAALQSLSQYADEDEDGDDVGEKLGGAPSSQPSSPAVVKEKTPSTSAPKPTSVGPIPTSSFYAKSSVKSSMKGKKRKSPEPEEEENSPRDRGRQQFSGSPRKFSHRRFAGNPYSRLSGGNNLRGGHSPRYGRKNNRNNFNRRRS